MTKFRYQVTGIMEFGGKMTVPELTTYLAKQLVGSEIIGITIYKLEEKKGGPGYSPIKEELKKTKMKD